MPGRLRKPRDLTALAAAEMVADGIAPVAGTLSGRAIPAAHGLQTRAEIARRAEETRWKENLPFREDPARVRIAP